MVLKRKANTAKHVQHTGSSMLGRWANDVKKLNRFFFSTYFCTFVKNSFYIFFFVHSLRTVSTFSFLAASTSCRILVAQFSSVAESRPTLCDPMDCMQQARLPRPSPTPGACSNSYPFSQWCHPTPSSSFHSLLLPSIVPSIRVFSDESVLHIRWPKDWSFSYCINPSNKYSKLISFRIDWLELLQSKGLSRVFSNTTVQKHQLFRAQLSLWYNSHIQTWLLEKP